MSDYDELYVEPDGTCHDCGIDLEDDPDGDHDEHHRQCWKCWRGEQEPEPVPLARERCPHCRRRLVEVTGARMVCPNAYCTGAPGRAA